MCLLVVQAGRTEPSHWCWGAQRHPLEQVYMVQWGESRGEWGGVEQGRGRPGRGQDSQRQHVPYPIHFHGPDPPTWINADHCQLYSQRRSKLICCNCWGLSQGKGRNAPLSWRPPAANVLLQHVSMGYVSGLGCPKSEYIKSPGRPWKIDFIDWIQREFQPEENEIIEILAICTERACLESHEWYRIQDWIGLLSKERRCAFNAWVKGGISSGTASLNTCRTNNTCHSSIMYCDLENYRKKVQRKGEEETRKIFDFMGLEKSLIMKRFFS